MKTKPWETINHNKLHTISHPYHDFYDLIDTSSLSQKDLCLIASSIFFNVYQHLFDSHFSKKNPISHRLFTLEEIMPPNSSLSHKENEWSISNHQGSVIKKGIFKLNTNEFYDLTLLDLSIQDMDTIELVKMVRAKSSNKLTRNELEFWLDRALRRFIFLSRDVEHRRGEKPYFDALKLIFDRNTSLSLDCGIKKISDASSLERTLLRRKKSYKLKSELHGKKHFALSIPERIRSSEEYKQLKTLEMNEIKS